MNYSKKTGLVICFALISGFIWYAFASPSVCKEIVRVNKEMSIDSAIYTVYKDKIEEMKAPDKVAFFLDIFKEFELHEGAFTSVMTIIDNDRDYVFIRNALLSRMKKTKRQKTNKNMIIAWLTTSNQDDFINAIQTLNKNNG